MTAQVPQGMPPEKVPLVEAERAAWAAYAESRGEPAEKRRELYAAASAATDRVAEFDRAGGGRAAA